MRRIAPLVALLGLGAASAATSSGCSTVTCGQDQNCTPAATEDTGDASQGSDAPRSEDATLLEAAAPDATALEAAPATDATDAPQAVDAVRGATLDATLDGGAPEAALDASADLDAAAFLDAPLDAGDGSDGFTCDPTQSPHDNACVLGDAYGVFVSPAGRDGGAGTMADPLKTIAAGIADAVQTGKTRVYVCTGSYAEQVTLGAQADGISLYSGLDCASGWAYGGTPAQVQGPSALYALRVDSTTKPVAIEDIAFSVPAATGQDDAGTGLSSIAAFVSNESAGVTFRRVSLTADDAASGSGGTAPATNLFSPDAGDLQGNGPDGGAGGASKDCPCKTWGGTQGGAGGNAGLPAQDGGPGVATPPATTVGLQDGLGGAGITAANGACTVGHTGGDGAQRSDGGAGAMATGVVGAAGWQPAAGSVGLAGDPGQGGGGGGGGASAGSGGGSCGGCGGAGGLAGHGGGASIALLLFQATIDFQAASLTTGHAGNGGPGSPGESGGAGGAGGDVGACAGGQGGNGVGGGGGGGGAGGLSVGVVADSSSRVTTDVATTFTAGPSGSGGGAGGGGQGGSSVFGQAPTGMPGTKGVDGLSQQQLFQ